MKNLCIILTILCACTVAQAQKTWKAYEQHVSFKIKNAGMGVNGSFGIIKTELSFSPDKLSASRLKGSVEIATINTGIKKRDKDLQSDKYFDAGNHKLVEVASTKLYKKGNQYAGMFNVTMKGKTKAYEIPFEFTQNGSEADFKGSFGMKRSDFGIGGKTLTLSDDLTVTIEIKAKG